MSYLNQTDVWLEELLKSLEPGVEIDAVKDALLVKIVESYRNGQRACPKCKPRTSRRPAPAS